MITGKLFLTSKSPTKIAVVLNVPSDMDIDEFFSIIEESVKDILIARVIKTSFTHNYAILLKFYDVEKMNIFREKFDGKEYNFMEEEKIRIKVVEKWHKVLDESSVIMEDGEGEQVREFDYFSYLIF